jgi:hypothetical protein
VVLYLPHRLHTSHEHADAQLLPADLKHIPQLVLLEAFVECAHVAEAVPLLQRGQILLLLMVCVCVCVCVCVREGGHCTVSGV